MGRVGLSAADDLAVRRIGWLDKCTFTGSINTVVEIA
jgi:hypothetical protein